MQKKMRFKVKIRLLYCVVRDSKVCKWDVCQDKISFAKDKTKQWEGKKETLEDRWRRWKSKNEYNLKQ